MSTVAKYSDLIVWQVAMELVTEIYRLTKSFPREEQFGLVSQMRRAAVSVASNIAEGHGRLHKPDYLRHLAIARGSLMELRTQLQIAVNLEYLPYEATELAWSLCDKAGRFLNNLIRALDQSIRSTPNNGRIFEESVAYNSAPPDEDA